MSLSTYDTARNRFEREHVLSSYTSQLKALTATPDLNVPVLTLFVPRTLVKRTLYFATDINSQYDGLIRFFDAHQLVLELPANSVTSQTVQLALKSYETDTVVTAEAAVRSQTINSLTYLTSAGQRIIVPPFTIMVRCTSIDYVLTKITALTPGVDKQLSLGCLSEILP